MSDTELTQRKSDHLRIVAEEDVAHRAASLLGDVQLLHQALPELNLSAIDTSVEFFGKRLANPLMITSMTGGAERAGELNRALAAVAAQCGVAFAVGSQRVMLHRPETCADFAVREELGADGVLLGNIGAAQLRQYEPAQIAALAQRIEADGMCVHLNVAHELAQDEGDRSFDGIVAALTRLVEALEGRVLVKETGAGLSPEALALLCGCGVKYIDVAGAGGTSWTRVEGYRVRTPKARAVAETFADWGIPTAFSVLAARRVCPPDCCIIGSGGIHTGLDAARTIACGARLAGVARSLLLAYTAGGVDGAVAHLRRMVHELRCAMLLTSAARVAELQQVRRVYTGRLREWLSAYRWLDLLEQNA